MSFPAKVLVLFFLFHLSACGNLPRFNHQDQDAPALTTAAMTGIVIQSTDSSYTSSAIYFYDLAAGKISLLSGGESGDTFVKWLDSKIYLFNRAAGRVNYSTFKPKSGIASRSTEQATPGAANYDPTNVAIGPAGELILAMNVANSLVFANSATATTTVSLANVDTGVATQVFRPTDIWVDANKVYVTHQALDANYKATGAGKIYSAISSNGTWAWESTTGNTISISNPVFVSTRSDHIAVIGGVCYTTAGTACVAGIDRFDANTGQSTHVSAWDASKWYPNGGFYDDLTDDTLLVCVQDKSTQKNVVARYTIADGSMITFFELSGAGCGGVIADRTAMRIFIGQSLADGTGSITIFDQAGTVQTSATMSSGISGMTASFD